MSLIPKPKKSRRWSIRQISLLSVFFAGLVSLLLPPWFQLPTRMLCVWDASIICFLGFTWTAMLKATPETMHHHARQEDIGRLVILSLITIAACSSLLAIGFILHDKGLATKLLFLHLALSLLTIVGSWLLVHTIFAFHYANLYYQQDKTLNQCKSEGLDFPGEIEPDYWDFLYFSFVIGMTSQVSDVQITSRLIRRLALLHSILSFFFNTMILAMSINIIAGLI
ncbi:DUF1345 domain-containing protein [Pelatocladus sp. BLCC-F211]|uniref:DUF1345 domain-containing protein n=1 Tax=Pelatocladus sp. BLCC-F211 TaxID=3342752 RepID=UPI0035B7CD22